MELEKLVKTLEQIRDRQLPTIMQNSVYHFVNRQEQIYKKQKPHVLKHQLAQEILAGEGIFYLIGTGNIEMLSPTHKMQLVTPLNKNIEILRVPTTGLLYVDPALKSIQKLVQPKEVPITLKEMILDVFSDNDLREIWKLRGELTYDGIFSQKSSTSNKYYASSINRGRDLYSSSRRKALSD